MNSISIILITKDEEDNIHQCLSTVRWADEIIIVDAGSSDSTLAKAKDFTQKIFVRPWEGYGAAKNFALTQIASEWAFWIDADERVTDSLRDEIQAKIGGENGSFVAYSMPRKANFLGKWILHCGWYPGRVTRIFRKESGHFTDSKVHERLVIDGPTGDLASDLLHFTDPSLSHYFRKLNKYTTLASNELEEDRISFGIAQITIRPVWTFIRMYFLRLGFLDGIPGFILCVLSSCYVFTKYAKLWERKQKESHAEIQA